MAAATFPNNIPRKVDQPLEPLEGRQTDELLAFTQCLTVPPPDPHPTLSPCTTAPLSSPSNPPVGVKEQEEVVVVNVPETVGVLPCESVTETGQLVYPILINGHPSQAFYDSGATISVMSQEYVEQLDLPTVRLTRPIRVVEFSRKGPILRHSVNVDVVELAGHRAPWQFVVSPVAPRPIVIGLDIEQAWQLARVPKLTASFP